jgi:hypothetical protein
MPDFVRVYGAFPIARNDAGQLNPDYDATTRHATADEACLAAQKFARTPPYVAGIAIARLIDPCCLDGRSRRLETEPSVVLL